MSILRHSMAVVVARAPVFAGLITRRSAGSDGENRNPGRVECVVSANELMRSGRVTAYLQRCPLFATHLHSSVTTELRGKCGRLLTVSGAKDIIFNQRSSSARPRGPSHWVDPETLRRTRVIHRPEKPERGSSVRTNAGRNKKWRTLDKGRLEGNKRTRSNGNANPGKSKPPTVQGPGSKVQGPDSGVNEDGTTERPAREPRVKPKKGPKPKQRVTWAGQDMLLLNKGDRVGPEVQPWASVRTERMPDDYYKYGPFGPHAWKGVSIGTPRKGTLCDNLVVFFSTVENEEEHEAGDIQDAITGYAKRVDQMDDEDVGVQYYFAFVRQVVEIPGQSPWEEWTLVSQVAVESGAELDKWTLGSKLDRRMWELLTRCVGWYRPDLVYVKRPAYQVRFEPQNEFLKGWVTLLDPVGGSSYYPTLCKLLGVDENETAEQVGTVFDGFSEEKKMECVEHVLASHPVCLLTPFTTQAWKAEQQQKSSSEMEVSHLDRESEIESIDDEGDEDDTNDDDELDEDFEPDDMEAFSGQFGEELLDFDESQSTGNEWEREALATEAIMQDAEALDDVDDEDWNEQAEMGTTRSTKGQETVEGTEDTVEEAELFLDAAVQPFTYTNLIKEVFIIRRALVEMAELRR